MIIIIFETVYCIINQFNLFTKFFDATLCKLKLGKLLCIYK